MFSTSCPQGPNTCMFRDSETSEFESYSEVEGPRRSVPPRWTPAIPSSYGATDSTPGAYNPSSWPPLGPPLPPSRPTRPDNDISFNRYQYYNKLGTYPSSKDTLLQQLVPDNSQTLNPESQPAKTQSSMVTIFSVWNTIVGSSLLVMPWGIERAGLVGGIVIILLIGLLCLYTSQRLLQVNSLYGRRNPEGEVPELCLELLGIHCHIICKLVSIFVLIGALIVYWVLMTNFFYYTVRYVFGWDVGVSSTSLYNVTNFTPSAICPRVEEQSLIEESNMDSWWHIQRTAPLVLVLIIAPLVNFKSATFFTKFNSLGTISLMYLLVIVLVKAASWGPHSDFTDTSSPYYIPLFKFSFPALSGTLSLSFFIHNIIISLMKNNRYQEYNSRDLTIAYSLSVITYIVVGIAFYICFPLLKTCIEDNFLNNFRSDDLLTATARACLLFQLITVYPLIIYMVRIQILKELTGQSYPGLKYVLCVNAVIITICILFAVFMPEVGTIVRYTGAIAGLIYVYIIPVLLHLQVLRRHNELTTLNCVLHCCIPVIGVINLISQFFVSTH